MDIKQTDGGLFYFVLPMRHDQAHSWDCLGCKNCALQMFWLTYLLIMSQYCRRSSSAVQFCAIFTIKEELSVCLSKLWDRAFLTFSGKSTSFTIRDPEFEYWSWSHPVQDHLFQFSKIIIIARNSTFYGQSINLLHSGSWIQSVFFIFKSYVFFYRASAYCCWRAILI